MQYVLLAVVVTAVLLMCLFPVWPMWAKLAVWYLTVAFSTFMTVLLVIRMICYVALWAFGADFWIFPNLLDEDLGVIESFQPLYSFAYRSDDWLMIVCRVLSVGVIAIAIHQLSQTHSLSDIGEFAKVQFLDIVEWGENKLQNGPEMKQRFPSLEQVKQETEIDGDNDTARVNTDYTTQDTVDYEEDIDETFEEESLHHHRRQDSGDSSREDGWSSPSVEGSGTQGTGTVTTILPPPRPRPKPAVKEVAALGGLFGGYSSSSESEDDSVEEMQDEQDESSVEGLTRTRLESGAKLVQSKVAPIELRGMIAELVRPTIEATGGGMREKALAAAPWPVRHQVARLQSLCGDDKSSAQWRQLECRLEDCLEESKLTMTRLAETTADGLAVYLHSLPKIPDLEGRSTEPSVVSSESVVDELMSQVSELPESSPEEVLGDGPTGAVVLSRPPEIDEAVLKQVTESRVTEVVDPEEVERELAALAATHEKEVARRKREDDFPIDGFKLASGELEERTSKWACKPNEGMDEMDRRRWIFSRTPRVHLKDPNRAADRSTHGLVGRWTSLQRRRAAAVHSAPY
ncbi:Translocation protein S62 [Perkinsus olseni]|uniref:Translocation protein SEC62 n=1 Tax=Perkinsus olseni TaxID=32597 RepID=A0A7J6QXY5_PEROL|nr:Translocation protein S62 [Perkinsus olseni]KAF4744237.1 Translocation protein S62 [Perkinsus olseni]